MNPIRRIVVATDFSAPAGRAVRRAALIAKEQRAELHLLHAVHPLALYPGPDFAPADDEITAAGTLDKLTALAAMLHEHYGIETFAATRIGRAHAVIADHAREVDADLLVAGARGVNTLLDLLVGSTAARVLRLAACPVLIVKNAEAAPYRQALAALDFQPASAAAPALGLALAPQARIELLYVYDENIEERMREAQLDTAFIADYRRRALAEAETRLEAAQPEGGAFARHVTTGYPAAAIVERIRSLRAELIVVGRHGKRGMQGFLLGSVAKDVANAAECDVLVLPPAATEAEKP